MCSDGQFERASWSTAPFFEGRTDRYIHMNGGIVTRLCSVTPGHIWMVSASSSSLFGLHGPQLRRFRSALISRSPPIITSVLHTVVQTLGQNLLNSPRSSPLPEDGSCKADATRVNTPESLAYSCRPSQAVYCG